METWSGELLGTDDTRTIELPATKTMRPEGLSWEELDLSRSDLEEQIRSRLTDHLRGLGLDGDTLVPSDKGAVRRLHAPQREALHNGERVFVERFGEELLSEHFAIGADVHPDKVRPILTEVVGDGEDARLFRLASLLWSVPVSRGFGRRMRYLVRDSSNGKLIGIFALCDPVFNLSVRDSWIGWNAQDRKDRLVNVMDAYVVGAVPPYSQLLGGKVVASLMTSQEVCDRFDVKYGNTRGIISNQHKNAKLVLMTVTSALGRSSLYNRLRLPGILEFELLGRTQGWGHFHVPEDIFADMRRLLELNGHAYASGYSFGQGPNWRMRVARAACDALGLRRNLLRHGMMREVYAAPLAAKWRECLQLGTPCHICRPTASDIGRAAIERWLIPRSERMPAYREWTIHDTWRALQVLHDP